MIIKEIIKILDSTIYRNYSDKNVYIKNKQTGMLFSDVNSIIDYEYEETNIPIPIEQEVISNDEI
jgi:hypothetical protein